jgi:pimeloyl-ACP methyl ester carboxylesterase
MRACLIALAVLGCCALVFGEGPRVRAAAATEASGTTTAATAPSAASASSPAIVIGFVGGYVSHNNLSHMEAHLAAQIRAAYPSGVYAAAFENHRRGSAHAAILRLLDANHDGKLSKQEKENARIILYGHSWGASEAVTLARKLKRQGIPVLLTIQVDSVEKFHENDAVIPSNVEEAANFYQTHGWLHGESRIRAADPERTKILGNFRFDYSKHPVGCYSAYPWWDRHLATAHTEIECDPAVWDRVEALIESELPPTDSATAATTPEPTQ